MATDNQDPSMGVAVGLSINDALFYDIFHAGDIFEQDNRYSLSDHNDITAKAFLVCPDFMEKLLPIFCDIYYHAKVADDGYRSGSMIDNCKKAQLVTDYTNAHPELPDSWDFMEVYLDKIRVDQEVIILPRSKKVVELNGLTVEQILKS